MAATLWITEMPMAGTGTGARPWSCAPTSHVPSGSGSHGSYVGAFADQAGAVKQDAIRLLTDATVRPTGTPGGSTG